MIGAPAMDPARAPRPTLSDLMSVAFRPIAVLSAFLPLLYLLPFGLEVHSDSSLLLAVNVVGPVSLILTCGWTAARTTHRYPFSILTAYVGLFAQTALFFGVGPLVYIFGNETTTERLASSRLGIGGFELLRTNLLVAVGVGSALLGLGISARLLAMRTTADESLKRTAFSLPTVALLFLIVGTLVRYGLALPYEFGLTTFVLPGFLRNLENLMPLGLALTGFLTVKRGGGWHALFWAVLLPNLAVAVLQFAKMAMVINVLLPAVGCYLAHRNLGRLTVWVVVTMVLFSAMQPLARYARNEIIRRGAMTHNLSERASIAMDFWTGDVDHGSDPDDQGAWTRLAYSGPQAYAMALYDNGYPSATLRDVWNIFIPRLLWPDKPVGIGPGQAFYEIVTGRRGSFLGLSVYADAYWQGGWLMVAIVGVLMGMLFGWLSDNSLRWLASSNFIYLPLILLGWQTSLLGPMKYIANGLLGPLPIYVMYMLTGALAGRLMPMTDREHTPGLSAS